MRTLFASILSVLVGLSAVIGLLALRADALMHTPEPLQAIAGTDGAGQELRQAVPQLLVTEAENELADSVPDFAGDAIAGLVGDFSETVVEDDRFDAAWDASLEQTRQSWVSGLEIARAEAESSGQPLDPEAGFIHMHVTPVADVAASVLEEQVQSFVSQLPGGEHLSSLTEDIGSVVPEEVVIRTQIPDPSAVSAQDLAFIQDNVEHWPFILLGSALAFVLVLLLAAPDSRWVVWLITGVILAVGGFVVRLWTDSFVQATIADAQGENYVTVIEPLMQSFQAWVNPQVTILFIAGGAMAVLGVIGALLSMSRTNDA